MILTYSSLCVCAQINLCSYVMSAEGASASAHSALEALEARGLGALVPQLRLQAQLQRQLAAEPAPQALYRWIKVCLMPTKSFATQCSETVYLSYGTTEL